MVNLWLTIYITVKNVFTNSVFKLGTLQVVTQLSRNKFQSFIDLFIKDISAILDFGEGGGIKLQCGLPG